MGEDTTASNEKYTKGEYLKLAANNQSHFAGENLETWRNLHLQAIDVAMHAGSNEAAFNQALFMEAASGHFLTDAFSAGHQFEKLPVLTAVQAELKGQPIQADNPSMQTYLAVADAADPLNIANLIVKAIHDRMNQEGFDVANNKGMKWRAFGDGYLAKSPETQRIAALAVFESRQQVFQARNAKTPPPVQESRNSSRPRTHATARRCRRSATSPRRGTKSNRSSTRSAKRPRASLVQPVATSLSTTSRRSATRPESKTSCAIRSSTERTEETGRRSSPRSLNGDSESKSADHDAPPPCRCTPDGCVRRRCRTGYAGFRSDVGARRDAAGNSDR